MTRRAIVSVAVGAWYPNGQQRLFDSLEERGENATRLFWRDAYPPGSPSHEEAPYAFKPHAFRVTRKLGFDQALWLDASVWADKRLDDIWARLDADGYYFEPDGNMVGEWISDAALELVGLTRDETMTMPLIEGKLIGLDFRDPTAQVFLEEWLSLAERGGFHGAWTNDDGSVSTDPRCRGHRHDIACGSPIVASLGLGLQKQRRLWIPVNGEGPDQAPDECCLIARGM